jgi:hypothetical protein
MPAGIKHGGSHTLQSYNRLCRLVAIVILMIFGVTCIDDYMDAAPAQFAEDRQKQRHPAHRNKRAFNYHLLLSVPRISLKRAIKRVLVI